MTRAAVIGGGVIGGGWVARFLLSGWDVSVADPDPKAPGKLADLLDSARASLPGLTDWAPPPEGRLTFAASIGEAVTGADWVVEAVPERLELKHRVIAEVQAAAPDVPLASATSGFRPSQLQEGAANPATIFVAHPFNPVYLIPLVELVGSPANPEPVLAAAEEVLTGLGMAPLRVRAEIDGHIADRLLEAVWREALWLVNDGVATTQDVDEAIRLGFGIRWAQMGLFETYRLGGGAGGMAQFLAQFGPALKWPWTKLMDVPDLTPELIDRIAAQSDAQSGHIGLNDLARARDRNLVALLRALAARGWGAGAVVKAQGRRLAPPAPDLTRPFTSLRRRVPSDWTDYNGHMNEAKYLEAFAQATDTVMEWLGCDPAYIAGGLSFFTAETHIRHIDEVREGVLVRIETQCLGGGPRKLHLFHRLFAVEAEGERFLASGEHMLVHVSLETRRGVEMPGVVGERAAAMIAGHAGLAWPEGAGRSVGKK